MGLEMGRYSQIIGIIGWVQCNPRGIYKRETGRSEAEGNVTVSRGTGRSEEAPPLPLKTEEGAVSQGMQAPLKPGEAGKQTLPRAAEGKEPTGLFQNC